MAFRSMLSRRGGDFRRLKDGEVKTVPSPRVAGEVLGPRVVPRVAGEVPGPRVVPWVAGEVPSPRVAPWVAGEVPSPQVALS